jgi:hypothetical protein
LSIISRNAPGALAWIGFSAHLVVGIVALRRHAELPARPLLSMLNLAVALCLLVYWVREWYGYLAHDITWYATDQLVPAYAIVVALASALALAGRYDGRVTHWFQWLVFGVDALVLTGAVFYFTFVRFDRMI